MENELNRIIDEIEDYIGGNVEGVETIDRMGLTVFLRAKLNEAYRLGQESLRKDAERAREWADAMFRYSREKKISAIEAVCVEIANFGFSRARDKAIDAAMEAK